MALTYHPLGHILAVGGAILAATVFVKVTSHAFTLVDRLVDRKKD